jgi:ArsR family transcriptional regulator, virulence genes transcriptional regulator
MPTQYNIELYKLKAELCKTFADPTRLIIISELRTGEKTVGSLQETLEISQPVVSRHLALLRQKGIVQARREGINIIYSLTDPKITEACDIVHNILLTRIAKNKDFADRLMISSKQEQLRLGKGG